MRHADYNRKTGNIPQAVLDSIKIERPVNLFITDIFFGPLARTQQTMLAILANHDQKVQIHETIEEIGNEKTLDGAFQLLEALEATEKQKLVLVVDEAIGCLKKIFDSMTDGSNGLAIGHGPMIELSARIHGNVHCCKIPYLGFVDFVQDTNGKIKVEQF